MWVYFSVFIFEFYGTLAFSKFLDAFCNYILLKITSKQGLFSFFRSVTEKNTITYKVIYITRFEMTSSKQIKFSQKI